MIPVWFFIVLILLIFYLLYLTRTTDETLIEMSRNHIRRFQDWKKETGR
ncbi:MAG: hypothetical protein ACXVMS_00450 [Flavisolibacter sp.]